MCSSGLGAFDCAPFDSLRGSAQDDGAILRGGDAFRGAGGEGGVEVEHVVEFAGDAGELVDQLEGFGVGDGAADLGEMEREDEEGG